MDPRTQERVERWDSRPFGGGYDELATLSENGFSGAVTAAGAWLFMLNGRIVGVLDGEIEDFEHASGTVHAAPDPALPLLCSMQERGGDPRGRYYTNETPLSEVDDTLQSGSFTGYVELSEQVLSGDYYLVYYGGRRMAVAFIGNAQRLLTGDEAFERADDEVGIYEVVDAAVEVTDVPETTDVLEETDDAIDRPATEPEVESDSSEAGSDPAASETPEASAADATAEPEPETAPEDGDGAASNDAARPASAAELREEVDPTDVPESGTDSSPPGDGTPVDAAGSDADSGSETAAGADDAGDESESDSTSVTATDREEDRPTTADSARSGASDAIGSGATESEVSEASTAESDSTEASTAESGTTPGNDGSATASNDGSTTASGPDPTEVEAAAAKLDERGIDWSTDDDDTDDDEVDERLEQEERWRETRSIPSIDPAKTSAGESRTRRRSADRSRRSSGGNVIDNSGAETDGPASASLNAGAESVGSGRRRSDAGSETASAGERDDRLQTLKQRLEEAIEARERLEEANEALEEERDGLRAKNERLSETIERLRAKVERLESELERERARSLEVGSGDAGGADHVPPEQALSGTNLFVRYGTKSDATLAMAHDGDADRTDVASNLRLEHHTDFDADEVTVTGQPFEEFLASTMEHGFVDWLTETLLFEVRDTGHADGMGDLYDAIPRIDRAELQATIPLEDEDEAVPNEVTFDVVAFDKMGTPLVVANLNDSREPANEEMLLEMEEAASAIKANYPDFGAAMVVTSSYFDPGALEVVEEATGGGFLSRGSKQSYVTLSRKHGYHLCLVECRSGGFHMTVPEL